MRISGFASGMDTETMVKDLMKAQRRPLDKLLQSKQLMNWKMDAYREINTKLLDFRKSMENLRLQGTFSATLPVSSNTDVVSVTSTGNSKSLSGLEITEVSLAKPQISASVKFFTSGVDTSKKLSDLGVTGDPDTGNVELTINGQNISIALDKTVGEALAQFEQAGVKASYSSTEKSFTFTSTTGGSASKVSIEGTTGSTDFLTKLGISTGTTGDSTDPTTNTFGNSDTVSSVQGRDKTQASATINGIVYKSDTNSITHDGIKFDLKGTLKQTDNPITIKVSTDENKIFEGIKKFVERYNSLISDLNGKLSERTYRDYKPLSDEERSALSEKQIEQWEEKAKSGLLARDPVISKVLSSLRLAMSSAVDGADANSTNKIDTLSEIGIGLSKDYRDNGKLVLDEDKLKSMIATDLTKVMEIFAKRSTSFPSTDTSNTVTNSTKFRESGVGIRVYEQLEATMKELMAKSLSGSESVLGKQLKSLDSRITTFEDKMSKMEERYWRQFTAMEKALSKANSQSSWLMQQFYGGQ